MKRIPTIRILVWLILLLPGFVASPAFSQKKKQKEDDTPRGLKLREAEFYFTEGEKYFILEDYAKALIYYQKALESNPENGTIHFKVAEVLARGTRQDDLLKASLSIENAIRLDRSNKFFYLSAASIYAGLTRFDKAAAAYENMLSEIKGTEEYLFELAAVYQYAGSPDRAIDAYNRAEKVFGVNETSSVQKIRLFLEKGAREEAVAEGEKLMRAFPDDERYVLAFSEVLSQNGMRVEAIRYLEKFIDANPVYPQAEMLLAGFYRDTNQEQKARPLLLRLFENVEVDLTSKLIVLGAYNTELNNNKNSGVSDPDKEAFAVALYEKLKGAHAEDAGIHIIGGDLFLSTGKMREAQKAYALAVETGDVTYEVWENLLFTEIQLDQYDVAIRHSTEALELFPNQGMIHYFNGFANLRKRQYADAIASLEQSKKLLTANPGLVSEVNGMLGDAYHATKDYVKSEKSFDDALSFNPNNESVLNNYSFYLAIRKSNLEKAEKMSSALIKLNPENPSFLDTHAWVLYVRQKYREARKVIEKAISTGKATATHFEHYGDILYQLGEVDAAVAQWEKARGLNAKSEVLNKKIANRKIYE